MDINLYYAPTTCALAPFITLTEAGADFEVTAINMRKGQNKTAEYLRLNPKHKVPVLVVDGEVLTENVAMHVWINRTFPTAGLLPSDPWQEVKAISMLAWCSSGIHPYLSRINNPAKVCDVDGTGDSIREHAAEVVYECFAIAEELLSGRDYFFETFTAPDAHFFWCYRRATQFELALGDYPNCQAHFERMQTRPSVQKLLAFEKETQAGFASAA
jgi:glutathione S-transferase